MGKNENMIVYTNYSKLSEQGSGCKFPRMTVQIEIPRIRLSFHLMT